jgi:hypothetical protein
MSTKTKVDKLWDELRGTINKAYAAAGDNEDLQALRDYAENVSWSDDLAALLGRETANERQHRRNRPTVPGFSAGTAAQCILMNNVRMGAEGDEMPSAVKFLVCRQTAIEAEVIGFLIRDYLSPEWCAAVNTLDYSELMKASA